MCGCIEKYIYYFLLHKEEASLRWPALQFEVGEIKRELQVFEAWELRIGSWNTIRCASFIAQSVRNLGLTQSYVAAGHPRWLDHIYANVRSASGGN